MGLDASPPHAVSSDKASGAGFGLTICASVSWIGVGHPHMVRFSRSQLLGSFLILAIILVVLLIKYLRILWWAQ